MKKKSLFGLTDLEFSVHAHLVLLSFGKVVYHSGEYVAEEAAHLIAARSWNKIEEKKD